MSSAPKHPAASNALEVLALSIKAGRKQRRWTREELAGRAGMNKETVTRIERADPGVAIGRFFDAAALTGVTLYSPSRDELAGERRRREHELSLLPSRIDSPRAATNDF